MFQPQAHNVSHLPFGSWCSACFRGRGLSLGHREDRAHDTLLVLIVRDRKSKGIWSHPVPSKDVVHPYPARAPMTDLDFMGYKRVILKSDQEPSIVALCDTVKNGWHGEVERAIQSVHGLARTLKDFLEQRSGIALESQSPVLAWLVEDCSNHLLLFHKGELHESHTAESRWSRGVCVGVRVKRTERIVMDETGTYVVQSVRRVPEEQRYDNRLLRNVRGTPWEPNPGGVSTDLPEPVLVIPQLLDVEPTPTRVYNSDNKSTRNVYIRKTDLERFGYTAGCRESEFHRAGQSMSG